MPTVCLGTVVPRPLVLGSPPLVSRSQVGPLALGEAALHPRALAPSLLQQNLVQPSSYYCFFSNITVVFQSLRWKWCFPADNILSVDKRDFFRPYFTCCHVLFIHNTERDSFIHSDSGSISDVWFFLTSFTFFFHGLALGALLQWRWGSCKRNPRAPIHNHILFSSQLLTLLSPLSSALQRVSLSPHPSRAESEVVRCSVISCQNTADAMLPIRTAKSHCSESKLWYICLSIRARASNLFKYIYTKCPLSWITQFIRASVLSLESIDYIRVQTVLPSFQLIISFYDTGIYLCVQALITLLMLSTWRWKMFVESL